MAVRRITVKSALVFLLLLLVARGADWRLPGRLNPFEPFSFDEPPGPFTRSKTARLASDPPACLAALASTGFRFQPVEDRNAATGCNLRNVVRVERTQVAVSASFLLSCSAAISLASWERHALQPAAERAFGEPVQRLEHLGSFACRNVYGRTDAPLSRHATADAIDVSAVVLRSGRRVRVDSQWNGGDRDPAAARFLHEMRDGACLFFDAVLSPDYNAAHADHLHLDRGPWRHCE